MEMRMRERGGMDRKIDGGEVKVSTSMFDLVCPALLFTACTFTLTSSSI
jgi:hypothetical protein